MKNVLFAAALFLFSSFAFGQGLGLHEVGGGVGYGSISFTSGSSTESLGGFVISAHANLGELMPNLELIPELQYLTTSKDVSGGTWKLSDFAINANVHYNIAMEGQVAPYVGAGLGYNSLSSEATVTVPFFGTITASGSDSRIGINLLAGANYKMNETMKIFVEPRYVLASDFNHFIIKAGVSVAMN